MTGAAHRGGVDPNGYVLCGGRSQRMGRDKALIGDPPWALRVAEALESAGCSEVVFVGGDPSLALMGREQIEDDEPFAGPLAAIASMAQRRHSSGLTGPVLVAACDLPNLDERSPRALLQEVSDGAQVAVFSVEGIPQWSLVAFSPVGLRLAVDARNSGIASMRGAFEKVARWLEAPDPVAISDIDEPTG